MPTEDIAEIIDREPPAHTPYSPHERQVIAGEAVAALSPMQLSCVVLAIREGLVPTVIADRLKISRRTARLHLERATETLSRHFGCLISVEDLHGGQRRLGEHDVPPINEGENYLGSEFGNLTHASNA
jgi:DNA-binding CsgD family transcriptional regulator